MKTDALSGRNVAFVLDAEPDSGSATVKSAKRVLQILELFKETRRPMSTTDIAVQLNYPISSTAALLKSLASLGYLTFDRRSRTYRASLRVGLLGGWTTGAGFAPEQLNDLTDRLAQESGHTVVLGIRNEIHIQYIRVVAPPARLRFYLPVGSRQRLVDTTMGKALLALDSDMSIDRLVRRANADRTDSQARIDPAEMRREMLEIRRSGYAWSTEGFFKGAGVVAAALSLNDDEPPVVLGVGGPADDVERDLHRLIALVCAAVREIAPNCPPAIASQTRQLRSGDLCFA